MNVGGEEGGFRLLHTRTPMSDFIVKNAFPDKMSIFLNRGNTTTSSLIPHALSYATPAVFKNLTRPKWIRNNIELIKCF